MIKTDDITIKYIYSGLFITEETWIHPQRLECTYEIICVLEGVVFLEENGVQYELEKGDIIILNPDVVHQGFKESHGKTSFYWLHFTIDDFCKLQIDSKVIRHYNNISLFKEILYMSNTPDYQSYILDANLLVLLGDIAYTLKRNDNYELKSVYEAAEWIRINSNKKITVNEVSMMYGYSSEYFSKLFKSVFFVGLKEFICRERMNVARNMLCNTTYSSKQIAAMLNFDDENQFVHFFKYHQEKSPARYRNSMCNIHMNNK